MKWSEFPRMTRLLLYMVFLRDKYAGAAVLQMLFWTPDILLIIDLKFMNQGKKKVSFLVEKWYYSYTKPALVQFPKISRWKSVELTKMGNVVPYKKIFQTKHVMILYLLVTFFHVKWLGFDSIEWFLGYMYTQKCMKKLQKSEFLRNAITSIPNRNMYSKLDTAILKQVSKLCRNFKLVSSELTEK